MSAPLNLPPTYRPMVHHRRERRSHLRRNVMRWTFAAILAIAWGCTFMISAASADAGRQSPAGHQTMKVSQWQAYCARPLGSDPARGPVDLCAPHAPAVVNLTAPTWRTLVKAHSRARHSITGAREWVWNKGNADTWTYPHSGIGDCDEQAIAIMSDLVRAGIPRGALRLASIHLWGTSNHLVVLVATPGGRLIIDPLRKRLRSEPLDRRVRITHQQTPGTPLLWIKTDASNSASKGAPS